MSGDVTKRPVPGKTHEPRSADRRLLLRRVAATLALIAAFATGAALTANRWGDLIVDSGRELDTPRQLSEGRLLYRDVRYWYGPFAPYLHSVLYRVAGVSVATLTTAGLISAALLLWVSYRTCRLFTDRIAAVATGMAIVFANIFGQYYSLNIFNFIMPYSYPATYGMLAALVSLFGLLRHVLGGPARYFVLSCAGLAVAALCKLEILFAVAIMHLVFIALTLIRRSWRAYYFTGYFFAMLLPALIYTFFYFRAGRQLWTDNLFMKGNLNTADFILTHSGLQDVLASFRDIGFSVAGYAGCLALMYLIGRFGSRPSAAFKPSHVLTFGGAAGCAAVTYLLGPFKVLRALPLALLGMFLIHALRAVRDRENRMETALTILGSLGLASLARIMLRSGAEHYGFYLAVPGILGAAVLWTQDFPKMIDRRSASRSPAYYGGLFVLLALSATHLVTTSQTARRFYGQTTHWLSTPAGTMPILAPYVGSVDRVVQDLIVYAGGKSVVVLPEGAALTFLAGAKNPLGIHSFLPFDFNGDYDEESMIRRFSEASPDFIVLIPRDVKEYGKKAIGVDYGQELAAWIETRYELFQQYRTTTYQVILLRKKQ